MDKNILEKIRGKTIVGIDRADTISKFKSKETHIKNNSTIIFLDDGSFIGIGLSLEMDELLLNYHDSST